MSEERDCILRAEGIAKSFQGRRVLTAASLRAFAGELRVLLGRNGAGKSTLLKCAAGVVGSDGGTVTFNHRAYLTPTLPKLAAAGLFYLPERHALSDAFTPRQQLEMLQKRFDGADCGSVARMLGIETCLDKRLNRLSGGELRRVEFAAILVRRPACVLADEPFRSVSPKDTELLCEILMSLVRSGTAVILTGHEIPTLFRIAQHVTWCAAGTTYELGPPDAARAHEGLRAAYLGELKDA